MVGERNASIPVSVSASACVSVSVCLFPVSGFACPCERARAPGIPLAVRRADGQTLTGSAI